MLSVLILLVVFTLITVASVPPTRKPTSHHRPTHTTLPERQHPPRLIARYRNGRFEWEQPAE